MKLRAVEAIAPVRIDLCGGTLDIWPLNLMFGQAVTVNMAVDIMATARVEPEVGGKIRVVSKDQRMENTFDSVSSLRHDHRLGLHTRLAQTFLPDGQGALISTTGRAPAGSGLGGSSALNIAMCAALARYCGARPPKPRILDIAKDVEAAHLGIPTGLQDYLASLYGGVNVFSFPPGGWRRRTAPAAVSAELECRVLLFFSGAARSSGINNWRMFNLVIGKDKKTMALFGRIAECALRAGEALIMGDMESFIGAVEDEWTARRRLFPGISTPAIDKAIAAGKRAGARTARICGAGGGGCFFLMADPEDRERVIQAVERTGAARLDYRLARQGVRTRLV